MLHEIPARLTVTIKPTGNCNLCCEYCYAGTPQKQLMAAESAKIIMEKIVRRAPKSRTKFLWHGAEPMLAGLEFYEFIVGVEDRLRAEGFAIENAMQTNGTLINREWAEFFRKNDFGVGVSLDGPQEVNDCTRRYIGGRGSFSDVEKGMEALEAAGVKFGCLVVLSSANIKSFRQIKEFFQKKNIGFEIIPFFPFGRGAERCGLALRENEYSSAQLDLFNNWLEQDGEIWETSVKRFVSPFFSEGGVCTFRGGCQKRFIGVDFDGCAYPCNRVCGEQHFSYGNLLESDFSEILSHPLRVALCDFKLELPAACKACDFGPICNGGCLADRLLSGKLDDVHPLCDEYKKIFNGIRSRLQSELPTKEAV